MGTHTLSAAQKKFYDDNGYLLGLPAIYTREEMGRINAELPNLLALLRELNEEGTTIVVVTHDMQLVTEYAHRTVILADGRVRAAGPTADVFADAELIEGAGLRLPPLRRA